MLEYILLRVTLYWVVKRIFATLASYYFEVASSRF